MGALYEDSQTEICECWVSMLKSNTLYDPASVAAVPLWPRLADVFQPQSYPEVLGRREGNAGCDPERLTQCGHAGAGQSPPPCPPIQAAQRPEMRILSRKKSAKSQGFGTESQLFLLKNC